eukprot:TRINITY_DN52155_c0_g1_i1.p6 TRINITY_DN52155_c0_g1~~TRINITY_DN52155_c0_g1_i1.p6  ORF type:complete len:104 (-),score=10.10 TRINITY_DN52155_c0_g1_i1:53-364(-)
MAEGGPLIYVDLAVVQYDIFEYQTDGYPMKIQVEDMEKLGIEGKFVCSMEILTTEMSVEAYKKLMEAKGHNWMKMLGEVAKKTAEKFQQKQQGFDWRKNMIKL